MIGRFNTSRAFLLVLSMSSASTLLISRPALTQKRVNLGIRRQIHCSPGSMLSAVVSQGPAEGEQQVPAPSLGNGDIEPRKEYVDELAYLQREFTQLNYVVKTLRSSIMEENTGSKYVLEALGAMEDSPSAPVRAPYAPDLPESGVKFDQSGLSKVVVEACGVLGFSFLSAVMSWLVLSRLWLLGGFIGAVLAYRNIDEDHLGGRLYRGIGRRTALLFTTRIFPAVVQMRQAAKEQVLLLPSRRAALKMAMSSLWWRVDSRFLAPLRRTFAERLIAPLSALLYTPLRKKAAVVRAETRKALSLVGRFLWLLELKYGILLKLRVLCACAVLGFSYLTRDSVDRVIAVGRPDDDRLASKQIVPRALSREDVRRRQEKQDRDRILQSVADTMAKRAIRARAVADEGLASTLREVSRYRKNSGVGINLNDAAAMLTFYVPGVDLWGDGDGTVAEVAPQKPVPVWVRRVEQSQAGQFMQGRYLELRAIFVYLVTKVAAVLRYVYYGTRKALSRFATENGDNIKLKIELWYEEIIQILYKVATFLRRASRGKTYARKRNVSLVNPWGLPFSSRIHFRDENEAR